MVGDSNDAIRHKKTDVPHRFAIEMLLEAVGRRQRFIRIVYMNDPPKNRHSIRSEQIHCAHQVMVTVQDMVFATPQLSAQGTHELRLLHDWHRRMDDACAKRSRLLVHRSLLVQYAIKGPIDFY